MMAREWGSLEAKRAYFYIADIVMTDLSPRVDRRTRRYRDLLVAAFALLLGAQTQADISSSRRTAVVRAVERVQPAVVSIHVIHREPVVYRHRDPFLDFFYPFYYRGERNRVSGGSGLIVTEDGHILTNAHVIGNRKRLRRVEISLSDGRTFAARTMQADRHTDLAILQVDAADLPVAPLGRSSDILVGEWAIAIGNPFDLGPTVSLGVVSAVDRDFSEPQGDYYYRDMIQTDASINPGNSGGPLVNADGQVIGINSFILTGSEYNLGSIGIGFAIPIDAARCVLEEIRTHGHVREAWTGILQLRDVTPALARYLELPDTKGALIAQIAVDSPAYMADLQQGDVIVAINGEAVGSAKEAKVILEGLSVAQECSLEIVNRGGDRQVIAFDLEEYPRREYAPRGWY